MKQRTVLIKRKQTMMITLYKIGAGGAIQEWSIERIDRDKIAIVWGQFNGAMQEQIETVEINKSGRNLEEQVISRIQSRINHQLDKGYCSSIDEAKSSIGLNASKLLKPMLAKVYDHAKQYNLGKMWWQYKYNGHRCLITRAGDKIFAYSRNGKPINTVDHIIKNLDIPEGCTLDGELYIHKTPLQTISSIVRRKQPDNAKLLYVVYDTIQSVSFGARLDFLAKLDMPDSMIMAPAFNSPTREMLSNHGIKTEAHARGFEGFMLRVPGKPYEPGKRSDQLLKVKTRYDAEATVTNITPSADGWAILHCVWMRKSFKMTSPGTMLEKTQVLDDKEFYIGKKVTFEYAEVTQDGTPFHPVAINFREEE